MAWPTLHGLSRAHQREFNAWNGAMNRCHNPKHPKFEQYGARGIKVCDRWRESFANFFEDMGERPSDKHTLDRIDVNGNYEPTNCRWTTQTVQQRNRRDAVQLTVNGITKSQAEWSRENGIDHRRIMKRLKSGWSHEDAVLTPLGWPRGYRKEF